MRGMTFAVLAEAREFGKAEIESRTFQEMQIGLKPGGTKTVGQAADNLIRLFKKQRHDFGKIRCPDLIAQFVHSGPVDHVHPTGGGP